MPKLSGTAGQVLFNDLLPEDMRNYSQTLGKKELNGLLSQLAKKHPDKYREISHRMMQLATQEAYYSGGFSVGLRHLKKSKAAKQIQDVLRKKVDNLLNSDLSSEEIDQQIISLTQEAKKQQDNVILQEALEEGNPLAYQVIGSGKGKPGNISSLRGFDGLYEDHRGKAIPVPVLESYSGGLSPIGYWASTYGGRKGVIDVKVGVGKSGYLSKQINQMIHRQLVTADDSETPPLTTIGYPTEVDDMDNVGSLLSHPIGGYERNTVLTPEILDDLKTKGHDEILVRSPILTGPEDGGIYSMDAGYREDGRLPLVGENVSMTAGQSVGERLAQISLSSKHSGGVAGTNKLTTGGFDSVNQMFQVPKIFKGGAAHAQKDGKVQSIIAAPAGGSYVMIDNERHYVSPDFEIKVKPGDEVEAGDVLSDGLPNPSEFVRHKGVGEGRRQFVKSMGNLLKDSGIEVDRRNIELIAKGAINHVQMENEYGPYMPDDIVPYSAIEHGYEPRDGFKDLEPKKARGRYLERPYLHYSIGTRVTPSVIANLEKFGIKDVSVHEDKPIFSELMVPASRNLHHDQDWMVQMYGSGLKSNLLKSVHTGKTSDQDSTSFVPAAAVGVNFGNVGKVRYPGEGYKRESDIPRNPNKDMYVTDRDKNFNILDDDLDEIFE